MTEKANKHFERDIEELFGDKMRSSDEACENMWSALANVSWHHPDHTEWDPIFNEVETAGWSFRGSGAMIARVIGRGDYMDWYCSGPYCTVADWIEEGLKSRGWTFTIDY